MNRSKFFKIRGAYGQWFKEKGVSSLDSGKQLRPSDWGDGGLVHSQEKEERRKRSCSGSSHASPFGKAEKIRLSVRCCGLNSEGGNQSSNFRNPEEAIARSSEMQGVKERSGKRGACWQGPLRPACQGERRQGPQMATDWWLALQIWIVTRLYSKLTGMHCCVSWCADCDGWARGAQVLVSCCHVFSFLWAWDTGDMFLTTRKPQKWQEVHGHVREITFR